MTKKDLSREKNKMETPLLVENVVGNMQVGEGAHKPIDETKSKLRNGKRLRFTVWVIGLFVVCFVGTGWSWWVSTVMMNDIGASAGDEAFEKLRVDFDCEIRKLALQYALKLQPFRNRASFQELVDTLNLRGGQPGGERLCPDDLQLPKGHRETSQPNFTVPLGKRLIFVDPKGVDDNPGTKLLPVKTANRAVALSRMMKGEDFVILFRQGTHYFTETIELDASDSGLSFQNYNGEEVWLSGATKVADKAKWVKHATKPNVWMLNCSLNEAVGLRIDRSRAVRARYPNWCTSEETLPSGYRCVGDSKDGKVVNPLDGFGSNLLTNWLPPQKKELNPPNFSVYEPHFPERPLGLNYKRFRLGVGGSYTGFLEPPAGYFCKEGHPVVPRGLSSKVLPNAPYKTPGTGVVHAWHPHHWASWMFQVDGENSNSTHLLFSKGGFQSSRGDKEAEAFFIENIEEELDAENEFFFKNDTKSLLYFSTSKPRGSVEVPTLKTLFRLTGSPSEPIMGIGFRGLNFRDTRYTFLDKHVAPSGGDWALSLRAGLEILGGVNNLTISRCTFEALDGNAILLKGFARNVVIEECDFHHLGGNAIALLGDTQGRGLPKEWGIGWDGTAGTQPRGTIIRKNFGYRLGLFEKQSSFLFQAKSMQTVFSENIFFHGPRAGINLNDGFGGGNLFRDNLLFSTVMETGDHGPFNSWDRQPYAHERLANGTYNMEKSFDEIRNNFFIANYYSQEAVDNDDGSLRFMTHDNVLVYGQNGMKSDFGGAINWVYNNLVAFNWGRGAYLQHKYLQRPGEEDRFFNNTLVLRDKTAGYLDFDCECLKVGGCIITHDNNIFNPSGTMDSMCNISFKERIDLGLDFGSTLNRLQSIERILQVARALLSM